MDLGALADQQALIRVLEDRFPDEKAKALAYQWSIAGLGADELLLKGLPQMMASQHEGPWLPRQGQTCLVGDGVRFHGDRTALDATNQRLRSGPPC